MEWLAGLGPDDREALGAAGRRRVAGRFSVEHQAEGMDRAYRAAVG
jgi:hypothetical protein